jgi:rhamnose utilization protein RhaD (predicted bifunctional aldolase and dehydrogenase)
MRFSHVPNQRADNLGTADTEGIRDLSMRLAANRLLVQASTGNTSVKSGDTLWIKASGKWLADAASPDFLIPVALSRARACLDAERTIPETENTRGAYASIETAMHAALSHKVVIHVHSVNAIAWAVRSDAVSALQGCLNGFAWQWVPYTLSGMPLAKRVQEACRYSPGTNVFVLGNHGLVVCGESLELAERLLEDVEECLRLEPRRPVARHELTCAEECGEALQECASVHGLAGDMLSRTILMGGVLYPCQILFLPSTVLTEKRSFLTEVARIPEHKPARPTPALRDQGDGFCGAGMTQSERELLFGLSHVVRRIYQSNAIRYLSSNEVSQILQFGGQYLVNANKRLDCQ